MEGEVGKYLTELNQRIRKGCSAHIAPEGRIYYMNHETKISSWLPPVESWDSGGTNLPYGWEAAVDKEGKTYYINHVNRTTTYEDPRKDTDEDPPMPREVELIRDPQMGFGFVAGSEKPVIVRFVTEGGPNEHKLMPGDQILKINGEDVMRAPREHVIERVRSCKQSVTLTVCQPLTNNTTRKSALLTAAKKAKLKNNPSRVRFAEGVVINGSPLYSPSPLDSCVPFLPNVLKVFMENGQTKSFKYDSTTTVQDVLNSLQEKLSIKCVDHFSLVTEHVKIARRNRMSILDQRDTLAKIAARPGAHHLRCVFRVMFVPKDAYDLLQKDPVAFEYLYVQCCNDMVQERFAPELKYDIALRLAALHIQQHALSSGVQGKVSIKSVERESGLDRFVPMSLLETMKRKELRKLLSHFLKQNQSLCAPGQKQLTALQAKLHYLKIISELPSYGAKCFSTNLKDSSPETALLISPRFGISQIACLRNTTLPLRCKPQQKHEKQTSFENRLQKASNLRQQQENKNFIMKPITLALIEEVSDVRVSKEDELSFLVEIFLKDPDKQTLNFSMEDRDAEELVLLLKGYHRLLSGRDLPIQWDVEDSWRTETVSSYHNRHSVQEAPWSYPSRPGAPGIRTLDLAVPPPPYASYEQQEKQMSRSSSREQFVISSMSSPTSVDHNMNETQFMTNGNEADGSAVTTVSQEQFHEQRITVQSRPIIDERHPGIDYQSVISMELLEDSSGDVDVDLFEAKNDEVIRRISEMNQIVVDAETYLCDDQDSDMYISHPPTVDDSEPMEHPPLKAADSLLLLTQQTQNTASTVAQQLEDEPSVLLDEEISPSESDTDSTPNDSPLHRSTPIRNSLNSNPRMGRRDSSFGLHSPDLLPGLNPGSSNIIEILKHLQSEEIQLPFAEGTLYLDPDIIDLTMIPPPITPDTADAREVSTPLNAPPTPFLDNGNLQKEIEKWVKVSEHFIKDQEFEPECSGMVLEDANDRPQGHDYRSVDTAKVVADLDNLCDALSEMQATNLGQKSYPKVTVSSLPSKESLDSFIASLSVPLPPMEGKSAEHVASNDDLSAFIIPPPPCSSPSTEAQNEVIARFMAAAEDMRRMIGNGHIIKPDNTNQMDLVPLPPSKESSHDFQKIWSSSPSSAMENSPENIMHSPDSHLQETLNILDNFTSDLDSEFQCGDSSGYDTLTSSLTSYCETITSDEVDSNSLAYINNNMEGGDLCGYSSFPNSAESTPVLEHVPTTLSVFSSTLLNSVPVTPRTKMSCIDATSPLSITSPSSTTSSDSSVILLEPLTADSCDSSDPKQQPRIRKTKLFSDSADTSEALHSGSCDNLPTSPNNPPSPDSRPASISRSSSWTSMTEIGGPVLEKTSASSLPPKSTGPAQHSHQSCLQRSFSKGPSISPVVPKKPAPPVPRKTTDKNEKISLPVQDCSSLEFTDSDVCPSRFIFSSEMRLVKNGITSTSASSKGSSHEEGLSSECLFRNPRGYSSDIERKDIAALTNGDIIADDASLFSTDTDSAKSQEMTCQMLMKALSNDHISISRSGGPFHQAQKDITTMIVHLEKLGHISLKAESSNSVSEDKFSAAKEALVNESRQFVTSSKLFVKSAMESSDKMIENMAVCVALLNRMFTVGELLIMHMCSEESIIFLIDRLKDVAIAYLHTVDAAKQAMGTGITNPQMGVLMHQATTLATALTSLMRTLRSISSN